MQAILKLAQSTQVAGQRQSGKDGSDFVCGKLNGLGHSRRC